jgi:hypothetical protein
MEGCRPSSVKRARRRLPQWLLCAASLTVGLTLVHLTSANRYIEDADRFPGWKGELPKEPIIPKALDQNPTGETVGYGEDGKVCWSPLKVVQWKYLSHDCPCVAPGPMTHTHACARCDSLNRRSTSIAISVCAHRDCMGRNRQF